MSHIDVLICTPGAMLEARYVKSLAETLAECHKRNITYQWLNAYSSLVHHAREQTMTGGQLDPSHKGPLGDSVTYNKIFWIDSDISWEPKDFFALYDSPHSIITGAYMISGGKLTSVRGEDTPEGMPPERVKKMKAIAEIENCGFGFIAMKSGVFECMERPWFVYGATPVPTKNGYIMDSLGEDVTWCCRIKDKGYKIHFDPSVLVGHTKKGPLNWE